MIELRVFVFKVIFFVLVDERIINEKEDDLKIIIVLKI